MLGFLDKHTLQLESRGISMPELTEKLGLSAEEATGWSARRAGMTPA